MRNGYARAMELGYPISYEVLEAGTPVYSSDEQQIGKVAHVLAVEDEDVFDGIVISEHLGSAGHRFVDADQIAEIFERGVLLKLGREASERLPEPSPNPAVMRDDPAESGHRSFEEKLKLAWEYMKGNY